MKPLLSLRVPIDDLVGLGPLVAETSQSDRVYSATLLRAGIYRPGFGPENVKGKRIRFSPEVLASMAPSIEGKKLDMEHSQALMDEVGFVRNSRMEASGADPNATRDRLRGDLVIQAVRSRFTDAIAFVEGRLAARQVPEVSVEIEKWAFRDATEEERASFDLDLIGGEFAGAALVAKGACSAEAGCGIGFSSSASTPSHLHFTAAKATTTGADAAVLVEPAATNGETALEGQEGTTMGNETKPCSCGGAPKEADIAALTAAKAALETEVAGLKKVLDEANARIAGFEKAEVDGLRSEILAHPAASGKDLKSLTGFEAPSKEALVVALTVLKATGKTVGLGRHTTETTRGESPPTPKADEALAGVRERFGLSKETNAALPPVMRRNSAKLGGGA